MRDRVAWRLVALLAAVVLGGVGVLGMRLRPYWVARYRGQHANLRGAFLVFAPLTGVHLEGANLKGANLRGANLSHASFDSIEVSRGQNFMVFHESDLSEADLTGANLQGAILFTAKLSRAILRNADLRQADLRTELDGADLRGALLQGADLRLANLAGADLTGAVLTGAHFDSVTRWPHGFDPLKHGAISTPWPPPAPSTHLTTGQVAHRRDAVSARYRGIGPR